MPITESQVERCATRNCLAEIQISNNSIYESTSYAQILNILHDLPFITFFQVVTSFLSCFFRLRISPHPHYKYLIHTDADFRLRPFSSKVASHVTACYQHLEWIPKFTSFKSMPQLDRAFLMKLRHTIQCASADRTWFISRSPYTNCKMRSAGFIK